ncbi:hypothetical protein HHI36_012907 [Cryptolaemus montrouzieri]|uniref:Uncharacterized protein n=1 Tax=Cryptolaemus montrouzieri TaxID=559131 RepID=A0ABD2NFK9_9CUCU
MSPGVANHPMLLSVATPSRDNNMPCTTTKGLLNEPGQNNCFLNSAVQGTSKKSSPGIDEIDGREVRAVASLLYLINESFKVGIFLDALKKSKCISLYKKKESQEEV